MPQKHKIEYAMSSRKKKAVLVFVILCLSLLSLLDHKKPRPQKTQRPESPRQTTAEDMQKYNCRTFIVTYIVDGDTIDIDTPDGDSDRTRIRLWGVDSPETKKPDTAVMYFGPEASEFTTQLTLRKKVCLYLENNNTRDKYSRLLAYVQLQDGTFLNETLVSQGYAYADLRFDHKFFNKYQQLEASARRQKRGLWKNVTRDQLPQWLQNEKPKLLEK